MDIMEGSILHHIAFVLLLLCGLVQLGYARPVVFLVSLLYLHAVNGHYTLRLQKRLQFEERKHANQRRLLSDTESVRWLNHAIEKIWPICMEKIASQQFLLPIIPWFLDKFKPWTAKKAVMQHFYLGRTPPMFTDIRILQESADDDHMVLELGMNFLSADDMSAKLAVQLRKRLGFGITTMMHITGMQVEGKKGVSLFNKKPLKGIEFLIKTKKIGASPEEVASFLKIALGLSATMIGDYLGDRDEFCLRVMHAYVDTMNFEGMNFGEAIRFFLRGFRLPGEAQIIDNGKVCKISDCPECSKDKIKAQFIISPRAFK